MAPTHHHRYIYPYNKDAVPPLSLQFSKPFYPPPTSPSSPLSVASSGSSISESPAYVVSQPSASAQAPTSLTLSPSSLSQSQLSSSQTPITIGQNSAPISHSSSESPSHLPSTSCPLSSSSLQHDCDSASLNRELRHFFADKLTSTAPPQKSQSRCRLIGIGESLTSGEAMKHLEAKIKLKKKRRRRNKREKEREKRRNNRIKKCVLLYVKRWYLNN